MIPTVLSIAGSDPTGGAGIQADLKTMTDIGVYGAAAVTCITVQNSRGVDRIMPLSPSLVAAQVRVVLDDHHVSHIKIGMVGTAEIAEAIGAILQPFRGEVIFDPVLAATTGQTLTRAGGLEAIQSHLLGQATVLTPNLPELALLAPATSDADSPLQAAEELLARFPRLRAVLVKGGHGSGRDLVDHLVYRDAADTVRRIDHRHTRVVTRNSHGTGCTLASAYAAFHSRLHDDPATFHASVDYLQELLQQSAGRNIIRRPDGRGPLLHARNPKGREAESVSTCDE